MLTNEYLLLREDDRSYPAVMVAMASAAALVGGTSIFFLLRGCGVETMDTCTPYPDQIYALLPVPSLAVTALLVQQAVVATMRGAFYVGYLFLLGIIIWSSLPVLRGYRHLDASLAAYMQRRRSEGIFRI